jgi:glyoxylase-like metal-dependent hydrolase (beta-lactamase superfamily II)
VWAGAKEIEGVKVTGLWKDVATKPDVLLAGGERIGSLEVVPSPGHTAGHVAFLDTRDRSLIAGDVFTAYGRPEVSNHFYWRFPLAYNATVDRAADLASARALRTLDPSRLAVGHGPVAEAPAAAMDAAIARSAKSLGDPA